MRVPTLTAMIAANNTMAMEVALAIFSIRGSGTEVAGERTRSARTHVGIAA
jgi:hypothetical protein